MTMFAIMYVLEESTRRAEAVASDAQVQNLTRVTWEERLYGGSEFGDLVHDAGEGM